VSSNGAETSRENVDSEDQSSRFIESDGKIGETVIAPLRVRATPWAGPM